LGIKGVILNKFIVLGRRKSKKGKLELFIQRLHIVSKECTTKSSNVEFQEEWSKSSTLKIRHGGGPIARCSQAGIRLSVEENTLRRKIFEKEQALEENYEKYSKKGNL
jgi:hypothetical protein